MKRMILVDGNSLMYRAYYGQGDPTKLKPNSKGIFTNAINAFARMIHNLVKTDYDAMLVAFDHSKHTFRHDIMSDYKAGRAKMPDEMRMQIAYLKDFLTRSNIMQYEVSLYEADDIIGTMSKKANALGYHVDIYSSDKDLLQLIDENVTVHMTKKGMSELEDFTPSHFKEVYQIESSQFIDLKALMGDKSDNISGVPGIGEKKGIKYLLEYGTIENLLLNVDSIKGADKDKFKENSELLKTCKKMVTILKDAPIEINVDDCIKKEPDYDKLKELYEYLELNGLLKELALNNKSKDKVDTNSFEYIDSNSRLKEILIPNSSLIFETYDYNYHKSDLVGFAIRNRLGSFSIDLSLLKESVDLKLFLSDKENDKNIYDFKRSYVALKKLGIKLDGVNFDMLLASYLLNPSITKSEFKNVCSYFDYYDVSFDEEIYGKGAKKQMPSKDILSQHLVKKANALYLLKNKIKEKIEENELSYLLYEVEMPLSRILADMEFEGVKVDRNELNLQKKDLKDRISFIESEIYRLCGKEFNIASPKQLGVVLFEDLNLPYPKKTKSSYSTDFETLDKIKHTHEVIPYILAYRQLTKLYQTYIEGLEEQIFPDNKVHTIFEQALTETGRLSSIEPNLQNIPVKTDEGKNIRKFFVPNDKEDSFFSADYSQIELRVLAHMANVGKLIESFNSDEDIHKRTAMEIFNQKDVTDLMRRQAKAVNFGIIYGESAYGLANNIGISNKEAQRFIDKYYESYPEIQNFMDLTIDFCKNNGYVKTIMNRRRYIPDINSNQYMVREFAKRTAMNAPIQGSAADIMKLAMVKIDKALKLNKLESKMLLQIHDEVIFEVKKGEEEKLKEIVVKEMEGAYKLSCKLSVSKDFGKSLYEV